MLNASWREVGNAQDVRVGIDREVRHRVKTSCWGRIVQDCDRMPEVFEGVLEELESVGRAAGESVPRQRRDARFRASEGQRNSARARRAVARQLGRGSPRQRRARLFLRLMNPGAGATCWCTHLRHGPNSSEWRDARGGGRGSARAAHPASRSPAADQFVEPEALLKRASSRG